MNNENNHHFIVFMLAAAMPLCAGDVSAGLPDERDPASEPPLKIENGVSLQADGSTRRLANEFLRVDLDAAKPRLTKLYLQGPDRRHYSTSLFKGTGEDFYNGFCKYKDGAGKWHFSFESPPPKVSVLIETAAEVKIQLQGVAFGSVVQDWTFSLKRGSRKLDLDINSKWIADTSVAEVYFPCFFFRYEERHGTTSAILHKGDRKADNRFGSDRATECEGLSYMALTEPGQWAIFKLYQNLLHKSACDLKILTSDHLIFGTTWWGDKKSLPNYWWLTGSSPRVGPPDQPEAYKAGQTLETRMEVTATDKRASGDQLLVSLPANPEAQRVEASLRSIYEEIINGGIWNSYNQLVVNNTSGFEWIGNIDPIMQAGLYGTETDPTTSNPLSMPQAMRGYLEKIHKSQDSFGMLTQGYGSGGYWIVVPLYVVGLHHYVTRTGDIEFLRSGIGTMERALEFLNTAWLGEGGLLTGGYQHATTFYDCVQTRGYVPILNAYYYRALQMAACLEEKLGNAAKAEIYRGRAAKIKENFHKKFWLPYSGHPLSETNISGVFADWVDEDWGGPGVVHAKVMTVSQFLPIEFGLVDDRDEMKRIFAQVDERMAKMPLGEPWLLPTNLFPWHYPSERNDVTGKWGYYMNAGTFGEWFVHEIKARAVAGQAERAYERLKQVAAKYDDQHLFEGSTTWSLAGKIYSDHYAEPYLSGQVDLTAAIPWALMGIEPSVNFIKIQPCIPDSLKGSAITITYLGKPLMIRINSNTSFTLKGSGALQVVARQLPGGSHTVTEGGVKIGKYTTDVAGEFTFPANLKPGREHTFTIEAEGKK
ncbi:MAG: hypothetical protein HY360_14985 [Verrucomicrobia bacterium]|nr:hypothetical protein [Verrucomicrobiota bacterium]